MAQVTGEVISLNEIQIDYPFQARYAFEDQALKASIQKRGILHPIVVASTSNRPKKVVIAGHKRIQIARELGLDKIKVNHVDDNLSDQDLFLASILSNWKQSIAEIDLAWILHQAANVYGFSEALILEEVLPAFDLKPEKRYLDESLRFFNLDSDLIGAVAHGKLPFRGSLSLEVLKPEDQKTFANKIVQEVALTTNQLIQVTEWLADLLKINSVSLQDFLSQPTLREVLESSKGDRRQKADQLIKALRQLRFPDLVQKEEAFGEKVREVRKAMQGLELQAPAYFEDEGYLMKIALKNPEALDRLSRVLKEKGNLLNSLFDIML